MNSNFTIKNFRVFDIKNGGTFKFSPITILTGCNSSGKSSVIKSLLLLKDFFNSIKSRSVSQCKLNFSNQEVKLGGFDIARNRDSKKDSRISFAYTTHSKQLGEELAVELSFGANRKDLLNNGWIEHIVVKKRSDSSVILDISYDYKHPDTPATVLTVNKIDLNPIVDGFYRAVYSTLVTFRANNTSFDGKSGEYSKEDLKKLNDLLDAYGHYATEEETDSLAKYASRMLGHHDEDIDKECSVYDLDLYTEALELGVMFPLPMLSLLKSAKKSEVRDILNKYVAEVEAKHNNEFPYRLLLNDVITAFEQSKYSNFISYYRAKEREALCTRGLKKMLFDADDWIKPSDKHEFFDDTIKSYSNLINIDSTVIERRGQDNYPHREREIDPTAFIAIFGLLARLCQYDDMRVFWRYISENSKSFSNVFGGTQYEEHNIFSDLCKYFDLTISSALAPSNYTRFKYLGDADIEIKRIYNSEYGGAMSTLLSKYLDACSNVEPEFESGDDETSDFDRISFCDATYFTPGSFINKWLKEFGIGERVSIELAGGGAGVQMRLFKDKDDKHGTLLADEGFGITKFIAILVNIEYHKLTEEKRFTLAIEEPETHLHPKYQSLLAEMFVDAYKSYGMHFIIETHSEYLIRKLQTLIAREEITPEDISIQYVYNANPERRPKGEPHVKHIPINTDGVLLDTFGPGFLDEADNLVMDILTSKVAR